MPSTKIIGELSRADLRWYAARDWSILAVGGALAVVLSEPGDWEPAWLVVLLGVATALASILPIGRPPVRLTVNTATVMIALALLGPAPALAFVPLIGCGFAAWGTRGVRRPWPLIRSDISLTAVWIAVAGIAFTAVVPAEIAPPIG